MGGTEEKVADGVASATECARFVKMKKPLANGASFGKTGGPKAGQCYAEIGMTGVRAEPNYIACSFGARPPLPHLLFQLHFGSPLWQYYHSLTHNIILVCRGCIFGAGDGDAGTEVKVAHGVASAKQCETIVKNLTPDANGASFNAKAAGQCFAEIGTTAQHRARAM